MSSKHASKAEDLAKQLTLTEFITEAKPNLGLVASFRVENTGKLDPRSQTEWEEAFKKQSAKVYK